MARPTPQDDPEGPRFDVQPPDPVPTRRRWPLIAVGIGAVVLLLVGVIAFVNAAPYSQQPTPHALPGAENRPDPAAADPAGDATPSNALPRR